MSKDESKQYEEWTGTAIYEGTIFRVSITASAGHWKKEAESAISKAGGRDSKLNTAKPTTFLPVLPPEGTEYIVMFTPDHSYTKDFPKRKQTTVFLSSKFSRLEYGQFQDWVRHFRFKPPAQVYCPKCGTPGYRGAICSNRACRTVLY